MSESATIIDYAMGIARDAVSTAASVALFVGASTTGLYHDNTVSGSEMLGLAAGGVSAATFTRNGSVADALFSGQVTISGNLIVNGTTTTINSTTVDVDDRVIRVNKSSGANDPAPTAITGISVYRGAVSSVARDHVGIFWDESASQWKFAVNTGGDDATLGAYSAVRVSAITAASAAFTANTNQIVLGTTNTTTITMASLASSRTVTFPDANSNTVVPSSAASHQFATAISSAGVITWTQPAFSDISGTASTTQGGTGLDGHLAANGALLIGNGTGYTLATLSAGTGISVTNASGTITLATTGAPPTGSAGGDLGGTFPNPTVLSISNVTTGTLGVTHGGNGLATATLGDIRYGSGTNTMAALAGNTTSAKQFLTQTGTGAVSAVPAWAAIVAGDIPASLNATTFAGITNSALTSGRVTYASTAGLLIDDSGFTRGSSALTVDAQVDGTYIFGYWKMGLATSGTSTLSYMAQYSNFTSTAFGLAQDANGATYVNAKTGQAVRLLVNNSARLVVTGSAATFSSGVPVTISDTTASTTSSTGALIVSGGAGFAGQVTVNAGVVTTGGNSILSSGRFISTSTLTSADTTGRCSMWRSGGTYLGTTAGDTLFQTDLVGVRNYIFTAGTTPAIVARILGTGDVEATTGNVIIATVGKGIQIKEGSNAKAGVATLASGTVTVSTTAVTASSRILLSRQSINGSTATGSLSVGTVSAGTSFVINSESALAAVLTGDTSIVYWCIIEPA